MVVVPMQTILSSGFTRTTSEPRPARVGRNGSRIRTWLEANVVAPGGTPGSRVEASARIAIERGIVRTLYARPLETLLATFGVSLVLQQTVRSIFSPLNRSVITPDWLSGSVELVPGLAITLNRLYILGFSLLVFAAP